jgi:hypothetical protein
MERVSAEQLAEWAAEARERWSVPGLAVGLFHEGENIVYPPILARPVAERDFEIVDYEWPGERLTFPRDGFVCLGVLAARTE